MAEGIGLQQYCFCLVKIGMENCIFVIKAIIFKYYSKKNRSLFLVPEPIVERFLASYILSFVKNYHMGLNNPRAPSEMGESKLDKNWWGICRALRPVCEIFEKIKEPVTKNCLEIDSG